MKSGIREIVGKEISGVMVKTRPEGQYPRTQLFLLFSDNSYFEFFSHISDIQGTSKVRVGDFDTLHRLVGDAAYHLAEEESPAPG